MDTVRGVSGESRILQSPPKQIWLAGKHVYGDMNRFEAQKEEAKCTAKKCCRIIEGDRCPFCNNRKVREPGEKDPCYLTEQDYISTGILEDVLKQNSIPYLKKDVMGAGMAIKVGPMLERSRFYVPYELLKNAMAIVDELFSAAEVEEDVEDEEGDQDE